jgi:hypothetical protein
MTDSNPCGWIDAARPGYPANPDAESWHWLRRKGSSTAEAWLWTDADCCEGEFEWSTDHYGYPEDVARYFDYLGPCQTPAEVAALVEAARREEREACEAGVSHRAKLARNMQETARGKEEAAYWQNRASALELGAAAIRARGDAIPGEYQSEAERERVELFNRLGRVTEELGLPMDATASRIIEVIRKRVDDEREACASLSVRVEVPPGAETWSPLEAWQEALVMLDAAFRAAIRARGDA